MRGSVNMRKMARAAICGAVLVPCVGGVCLGLTSFRKASCAKLDDQENKPLQKAFKLFFNRPGWLQKKVDEGAIPPAIMSRLRVMLSSIYDQSFLHNPAKVVRLKENAAGMQQFLLEGSAVLEVRQEEMGQIVEQIINAQWQKIAVPVLLFSCGLGALGGLYGMFYSPSFTKYSSYCRAFRARSVFVQRPSKFEEKASYKKRTVDLTKVALREVIETKVEKGIAESSVFSDSECTALLIRGAHGVGKSTWAARFCIQKSSENDYELWDLSSLINETLGERTTITRDIAAVCKLHTEVNPFHALSDGLDYKPLTLRPRFLNGLIKKRVVLVEDVDVFIGIYGKQQMTALLSTLLDHLGEKDILLCTADDTNARSEVEEVFSGDDIVLVDLVPEEKHVEELLRRFSSDSEKATFVREVWRSGKANISLLAHLANCPFVTREGLQREVVRYESTKSRRATIFAGMERWDGSANNPFNNPPKKQ